jgi:hypothetical protein
MGTLNFAGVSRTAGVLRFRTASDDKRFAQLIKLGDTDIEFVRINADSKSAAAKELLTRNFANGRADIEALLVSMVKDENPFKAKKARTVTVKKSELVADEGKMSAKEAAKIRAEFNARVKAAYEAN